MQPVRESLRSTSEWVWALRMLVAFMNDMMVPTWRRAGYRVLPYLDDNGGHNRQEQVAAAQALHIRTDITTIGGVLNLPKCTIRPVQEMQMLGIIIRTNNSVVMSVRRNYPKKGARILNQIKAIFEDLQEEFPSATCTPCQENCKNRRRHDNGGGKTGVWKEFCFPAYGKSPPAFYSPSKKKMAHDCLHHEWLKRGRQRGPQSYSRTNGMYC
jgi:hypothetical protein